VRRGAAAAEPPARRRPGRGVVLAVGSVLLVLVVGAAILTQVGGDDGEPAPPPNTVDTPSASAGGGDSGASSASRAERAQTNVAVLNGTTVNGLARSVANRLDEEGYTIGTVTDASNQAQPNTRVEYGNGHRAAAQEVAKGIDVPADQVQPLDPVDGATAGSTAEVVVVVGENFAR
jgi:hypothetical protein